MRGPTRTTQPEEGAALRDWRERSGFRQSELAERAKISQNLLSLLEAGKRNFTKDSSEKIYRAVKELNAERAERLNEISVNRDSESLEIEHLQRKGAPKEDLRRVASILAKKVQVLRAQNESLRAMNQNPQIAELQRAWMEQNIKPLTAKITDLESQIADLRRLAGLKTEAIGKEAEAQDLQEQIEQRVRKGK